MRVKHFKYIVLLALGILSIIIYYIAPQSYSSSYTILCTIIYALSSVLMLMNNCSHTLIKFELLFTIAFFFTNFAYALVFYQINPYFSLFRLEFNESYICKGLALSTIAATWFNIGVFEKSPIIISRDTFQTPPLKIYATFAIILFLIFLPSLYQIYQSNAYSTEFESSYINIILRYVIFYSIFAFTYNYRNSKKNLLVQRGIQSPVMILTIVYCCLFLLIGSRGIPMRIALFALFVINLFIYRFTKFQISIIILVGAFILTFVGIAREGTSVAEGTITSIWDLGSDLTINNRSLYVLMEHADKMGYTYGQTMVMNICSIIPFAQSILLGITNWPESHISSGYLVTDLYFNDKPTEKIIGLGTNLVGDVYLSFGSLGVIILFFILGHYLRKLYLQIKFGSTQSALIYALIFMNAIIYSRSGYLTPLRDVIWTLIIYWFATSKIKLRTK